MSWSLTTSRLSPAKKNVSPGESEAAKRSSHLAERPPPASAARIDAHLEHLGVDDDPGIHPVPRGLLGMAEAPYAVGIARNALELVVGFQRVTAVLDEGENAREHLFVHPGKGEAGADFRQ